MFLLLLIFFSRRFSDHTWSTFLRLFVVDMQYTRPGSESQHQEFSGITAFGWFWVRLPETESAVHNTTWLLFLGGGELYYIGRKLEKEVKWAAKGQSHLMSGCNVRNPRNGMINLLESVSLPEASGQVPSICNLYKKSLNKTQYWS